MKVKFKLLVTVITLIAVITSCEGTFDADKEAAKLPGLLKKIRPTYIENQYTANVSLTPTNLLELLPDINEYPITVEAYDSSSVEAVEIFTSSEKAGSGTDGLYVQMAEKFNRQRNKLSNGKTAQISIRKIASGAAASFLIAGQNTPDAYSPSNHLWGQMIEAQGVNLKTIADVTAPNTAGVIVQNDKADRIMENGSLSVQKLLNEVTSGQFSMGYTNPYQSSTGLNFLLTILNTFAQGSEDNMLNPDVAAAFEAFQRGIPFVAQNTIQMRDATVNSGVLDAFVMEYQTFEKAKGLGGYQFIPFGVRHDSPLYATDAADGDEIEVLELFADFLKSNSKEVQKFGFNQGPKHTNQYNISDGTVISSAQRLWKDKKSGGKPIAAMFIADVSGSMDGNRIQALKTALNDSSGLISAKNSIGLVTFNDKVNVTLPIREFNLQQKALFLGAVEEMSAGGGTATNDAILVALDELQKFGERNPQYKLMAFILSDGEQTNGYDLSRTANVMKGIGIPVHSIAYGFESDDLKTIASLVEASYTKSSDKSASYNIGNLLNAQM